MIGYSDIPSRASLNASSYHGSYIVSYSTECVAIEVELVLGHTCITIFSVNIKCMQIIILGTCYGYPLHGCLG